MLVEFATEHLTDRVMTLCVGQNHREETQNIQNLKCHDRNECWRTGGKLVKIKEERGLLERLIVISRSRPQLDLKKCIAALAPMNLV